MCTQNCSLTLLIPTCDVVVLGNIHRTTMRRLPENRKLQQQSCENLNTIIATLLVILYFCKFIPHLKWKIQLRTICVIIAGVVQILFLLTPHFWQTGCRPVMWQADLLQQHQQIKIFPLFFYLTKETWFSTRCAVNKLKAMGSEQKISKSYWSILSPEEFVRDILYATY